MEIIFDGIKKAIILIFGGDKETYSILLNTIKVSSISLFISMLVGFPIGALIGLNKFFAKSLIITIINIGMGIPPIVVGLILTLFIWRSGILGFLELMYSNTAMIIAQIIIVFPIILGITIAAFQQINVGLINQAKSLGANKIQLFWILLKEIKFSIFVAIAAGFGRAVSEVGAVLIVGGNIKSETRVLTTAILQMIKVGKFDQAIALAAILFLLSFTINVIITIYQRKNLFLGI